MKNPNNRHHTQRSRIRALTKKLQLPPGEPIPDDELDSVERTLRYLVTIEEEPSSSYSRQLISDGIELPPPDSLTANEVDQALRNVIIGLARRHAFLHSTDHLSNRELYRYLWEKTLNEPAHELDETLGDSSCHIDLLGDGSEESELLFLQYYADDLERALWSEDFPDETIPPRLDRPSDRDRHLILSEPEEG